VSWLIKQDRRF